MICPLTDKVIARNCPVSSCMWHAIHAPHRCVAPTGDNTRSESTLANLKGFSTEEYTAYANKGVKSIERIIILNAFLEWIKNQDYSIRMPRTALPYLQSLRNTYPFSIPIMGWTTKTMGLSLMERPWLDFFNQHPKMKSEPHLRILGLTRSKLREINQQLHRMSLT